MEWESLGDDDIRIAADNDDSALDNWRHQLQHASPFTDALEIDSNNMQSSTPAEVIPITELWSSSLSLERKHNNISDCDETEYLQSSDVENLSDDQRHAYDIMEWHLEETIAGKNPLNY